MAQYRVAVPTAYDGSRCSGRALRPDTPDRVLPERWPGSASDWLLYKKRRLRNQIDKTAAAETRVTRTAPCCHHGFAARSSASSAVTDSARPALPDGSAEACRGPRSAFHGPAAGRARWLAAVSLGGEPLTECFPCASAVDSPPRDGRGEASTPCPSKPCAGGGRLRRSSSDRLSLARRLIGSDPPAQCATARRFRRPPCPAPRTH